jgi:hypothetical protein
MEYSEVKQHVTATPGLLTNLLTVHDAPQHLPANAGGRCARLPRAEATRRTSMAWKKVAKHKVGLLSAEAGRHPYN